jgi:protein disulfide-isomerase A1
LNDIPDQIRGFPTIKLYPAGKKDAPVEYTGDRSVEDLIAFMKEKGTHGIEVSIMDPVQVQDQGQAAPGGAEGVKEDPEKVAEAVKGSEGVHDEL